MEGDGGHEAIQLAMAEEEAWKRNTDCIYFLASPLTCKKGSECDYRHSEGARFNPRDCWYWLNGNCLNPKCSFRHPPLGSLFAEEMPNTGPPPRPSQTSASTLTPAARPPNNGCKKCVPCYYFQRGQCLKGESCPFMHGLQASASFLPQQPTKVSMTSAAPLQSNDQNVQKKISVQQNMQEFRHDSPETPVNMHFESLSSETVRFVAHEPSKNKILPPHSLDEEPPALPQNGVPVNNGYSQSQLWNNQVQPTEEEPDDDRDADEFLWEHSPGFDVLVEDDIEDPDYYQNEDNFRRMSAHVGQNMEAEDEFDYHHSDYEPVKKVDGDQYNGMVSYDNYELPEGRYGSESKTALRSLERASSVERRGTDRETKSDAVNESDLRYQLYKRRRSNGTQSTSNYGCHSELYRKDEQYVEERCYFYCSHEDMKFPPEQFISGRLQGRIAFPCRSVTDATNNMFSEKESGRGPRGRGRGRWSPTRRTNYKTRNLVRIRHHPSEIFTKDERIHQKRTILKDGTNSLDFVGPKSLAELKSAKNNENIQEIKVVGSNNLECLYEPEIPFEDPLPLTAMLKKKRELTYVENVVSTAQHENNESGYSSSHETVPQLEAKTEGNTIVNHDKGMIRTENELSFDGHCPTEANALETEDGMGLENAKEEEMGNSDKQNGDFNYESGKDEEDDHKNTPQPSEDDVDDDDDFAMKVSEMLS